MVYLKKYCILKRKVLHSIKEITRKPSGEPMVLAPAFTQSHHFQPQTGGYGWLGVHGGTGGHCGGQRGHGEHRRRRKHRSEGQWMGVQVCPIPC